MENLEEKSEIKENLENQVSVGWGDDLYFPRGLLKTNGVWRDRASTLDYLDSKSDLSRFEEELFASVPCDFEEELSFNSNLVRFIKYRENNPAEEYKTLDVAKNIWPQINKTDYLFQHMYKMFQTYPLVFNRSRSGHFNVKLTNKEIYTMLARRKLKKGIKFQRMIRARTTHRPSKREVSIETIRRYARTPNITAKELSVKCEIAVPTAAAYIAHANRTVAKDKKIVLNINGSTETLKAFHAELLTQQENGKFQGLKFSLKKV